MPHAADFRPVQSFGAVEKEISGRARAVCPPGFNVRCSCHRLGSARRAAKIQGCQMKKVPIIIPYYRAPDKLERCLAAIRGQTYEQYRCVRSR